MARVRSDVVAVPRKRKAAVDAAGEQTQALIASASVLSKMPAYARRARPITEDWQSLAWLYFDTIGEYRYSCNWVGNLLSKAKLIVLKNGKPLVDDKGAPLEPEVWEILRQLYGGTEGQTEMLRLLGIHATVTGDCYIVGETKAGVDRWAMFASTELTRESQTKWRSTEDVFLDPLVIRIWRPHPQRPHLADAPTRAVLPVLSQIDGLTKHDGATIDSRLAGAGLLILPDTISFGAAPIQKTEGTGDDEVTKESEDQDAVGLAEEIGRAASLSIADRTNASAVVPIIVQVPIEAVDKVQHVTFWSEFDEQAPKLMEQALHRLALGMDMPPEILTGTADSNHWSAWQVDESSIKIHSEPLLAQLNDSLSVGYLRPLLVADLKMKVTDAQQYSVGADTSAMRLRPDRSKEAIEMWDRGAINTKAMLRENGFDPDTDIMGTDERILWLVLKTAQGSNSPEIVADALRLAGVKLPALASPDGTSNEERPAPTKEDHPTRELPAGGPDALAAGASMLVFRALERAGNRMRTKMNSKVPGVSAAQTYMHFTTRPADLDDLLRDAWGEPVEQLAMQVGMLAAQLEAGLDTYARQLLVTRAKHDPELMRSYLIVTAAT